MTNATEILVTGAGGFVGQHVVKQLLERGHSVVAMVRRPEQQEWLRRLGARVVIGDLRDSKSLVAACSGVRGIINIASTFRSAKIADSVYHDINVQGVKNLFEAAIGSGVRRLIHCSTVGVHGHIEHPPADENTPFAPGDIYQETKLAGELIAQRYFEEQKITGGVIRPAMIWGPADTRTAKLIRSVVAGKFFYVGASQALVHFVDVRYLAHCFIEYLLHESLHAQTFIVSGRESLPLREMCNKIAHSAGVPPPKFTLPLSLMRVAARLCEQVCKPLGIEPPLFPRRIEFFTKHRSFDSTAVRQMLQQEAPYTLEAEIVHLLCSYGLLPIGVPQSDLILDSQDRVLYLSDKAEKWCGFTLAQAVGAHVRILRFPENWKQMCVQLRATLQGPISETICCFSLE
jgi:nucleoside-diphosphate-sugar epimerase